MFLTLVAGILLFCIFTISVISQQYFFAKKLEPAFVGALVAASGTIFAGCIAYSAASENVRIANEARLEAVRDRDVLAAKVAKDAQDAKLAEMRAIDGLKQRVDRLIGQFDGATNAGPNDYFQKIYDAEQYGALTFRIRRNVPEDLIARATDAFDHITGIKNAVMRAVLERNNIEPGVFESNRAEANDVIKKNLAELKELSDYLASEIDIRKKQ